MPGFGTHIQDQVQASHSSDGQLLSQDWTLSASPAIWPALASANSDPASTRLRRAELPQPLATRLDESFLKYRPRSLTEPGRGGTGKTQVCGACMAWLPRTPYNQWSAASDLGPCMCEFQVKVGKLPETQVQNARSRFLLFGRGPSS